MGVVGVGAVRVLLIRQISGVVIVRGRLRGVTYRVVIKAMGVGFSQFEKVASVAPASHQMVVMGGGVALSGLDQNCSPVCSLWCWLLLACSDETGYWLVKRCGQCGTTADL